MEDKELVGQKAKFVLRNGYSYTAQIVSVNDREIQIVDRFNFTILLNRNEIVLLQILKGGQI